MSPFTHPCLVTEAEAVVLIFSLHWAHGGDVLEEGEGFGNGFHVFDEETATVVHVAEFAAQRFALQVR